MPKGSSAASKPSPKSSSGRKDKAADMPPRESSSRAGNLSARRQARQKERADKRPATNTVTATVTNAASDAEVGRAMALAILNGGDGLDFFGPPGASASCNIDMMGTMTGTLTGTYDIGAPKLNVSRGRTAEELLEAGAIDASEYNRVVHQMTPRSGAARLRALDEADSTIVQVPKSQQAAARAAAAAGAGARAGAAVNGGAGGAGGGKPFEVFAPPPPRAGGGGGFGSGGMSFDVLVPQQRVGGGGGGMAFEVPQGSLALQRARSDGFAPDSYRSAPFASAAPTPPRLAHEGSREQLQAIQAMQQAHQAELRDKEAELRDKEAELKHAYERLKQAEAHALRLERDASRESLSQSGRDDEPGAGRTPQRKSVRAPLAAAAVAGGGGGGSPIGLGARRSVSSGALASWPPAAQALIRDLEGELELAQARAEAQEDVLKAMAAEHSQLHAHLSKLEASRAGGGRGDGKAGGSASPGGGADDAEHDSWTLGAFLASLGLNDTLAEAMLSAHRENVEGWTWFAPTSSRGGSRGGRVNELEFVLQLAAKGGGAAAGRKALVDLLGKGGALERLATKLWSGIEQLKKNEAHTGAELQSKFLQEGAGMLSYGGLSTFYGGLEAIVGAPDPNVGEAMAKEHTQRADADAWFTAGNYGIRTTSAIEWRFVTCPEQGPDGGAKKGNQGGMPAWPQETKNLTAVRDGGVEVSIQRQPLAVDALAAATGARNARLRELKEPELRIEEAFGARLYTGPCFFKYNSVRCCPLVASDCPLIAL